MVLEVQWLSTVSPMLWDFQLLTVEFTKDHHTYRLAHKVTPEHVIQEVSLQHLDKELINSNLGLFHYFVEGRRVEACELGEEQLQEQQY